MYKEPWEKEESEDSLRYAKRLMVMQIPIESKMLFIMNEFMEYYDLSEKRNSEWSRQIGGDDMFVNVIITSQELKDRAALEINKQIKDNQ